MTRNGITLVVSAPSGAGKSTLCKMLLNEFPNIQYSISCTTRKPRKGEVDGKDYIFLSRAAFEKQIRDNKLAEWAEVHGNLYGTPVEPVKNSLEEGRDILFDIDVQGANLIKNRFPQTKCAFIVPPVFTELERRLRSRGLDDDLTIQKRLRNAKTEIREAIWYDALIINDRLEDAFTMLKSFYLGAILSPHCQSSFLNHLLKEVM